MTMESPSGSHSWNLMEPDPGAFTSLCSEIGADKIQVEELDIGLERNQLYNLRPVHGLMVLVKHKTEFIAHPPADTAFSSAIKNDNIYFSNQIVHDAYAMHALLNILLNCTDSIDVGSELKHFKQFTHDFPPMLKGFTLTNSQTFRKAYNSLSLAPSHRVDRQNEDNEIYHPISYITHNGSLWELDGLKKSPIRLGSCSDTNWLDIARSEITQKCDLYHKQNLPVSLWAVIEDRKLVYQRKLIGKNYIKAEIENRLDYFQPSWRTTIDFAHWKEEFNYAMRNERNKLGQMLSLQLLENYCRSFDQLSTEDQLGVKSLLNDYVKQKDIMDAWLQIQDESLRIYECLGSEVEKQKLYERTRSQRTHDYMPFIRSYINALLEEGHLQHLINNHTTAIP